MENTMYCDGYIESHHSYFMMFVTTMGNIYKNITPQGDRTCAWRNSLGRLTSPRFSKEFD